MSEIVVGDPITITGPFDCATQDLFFRDIDKDDTDHIADYGRDVSIRFNRWPRLQFLYRWIARWLPWVSRRIPGWAYRTWTCECVLSKYKVLADKGELTRYEATLQPKGVARWAIGKPPQGAD